jgi:hypothetical protein
MRRVYGMHIGDSIAVASNDDTVGGGGIVGRLADWATSQGIDLRMLGFEGVDGHATQRVEGIGGYEFSEFVAHLSNRVDHYRNPTYVPMLGSAATSVCQRLDFVIDACGANNLNNPGEPTATTHAQHIAWLTALRAALDARGWTDCKIVVMGGYLDIQTFHAAVVAANATVQTAVYDVIDAANPGRPLVRLTNWYDLVGAWSASTYADTIHIKGAGYDLVMDGPTGMKAVLGPVIQAFANDESIPMGSLSTDGKNALLNHQHNKATYSPAATHYLHLYSGVGGTTPLAGTGNGYAAVSKTNNTTTWPNASGRVKSNGTAWTFPAPTGTWPDVTGWKLTDNPTEGAGTVLAQDTHTAVPVSLAGNTGPISYGVGAITITLAQSTTGGRFEDAVVHSLLNLMFGGTAYSQLATTYLSYWNIDPRTGGAAQVGSRQAITQASVWGVANAGRAVSAIDVSLTHQATGTYIAEHDASSGGSLLRSAFRPASVGASGVILAGQLYGTLSG